MKRIECVYRMAIELATEIIGKVPLGTLAMQALAQKHFGCGTATGAYGRADIYNALELGFNMFLHVQQRSGSLTVPVSGEPSLASYKIIREILRKLPTQTVRSEGQLDFQQFSTPPHLAFLAAWVTGLQKGEQVLEPSAGLGGLAIHALNAGCALFLNELEEDRFKLLQILFRDHGEVTVIQDDAEVIHALYPTLQPDVVLMNPPYTSNGATGFKSKFIGLEHLKKAVSMVKEGGRVVCFLYGGRPNFRNDQGGASMYNTEYAAHWKELQKTCTIRANVSFPGAEYLKYGTGINTRLIVIDKNGPQRGNTVEYEFTDNTDLEENFFRIMEPVRQIRFDNNEKVKEVQKSIPRAHMLLAKQDIWHLKQTPRELPETTGNETARQVDNHSAPDEPIAIKDRKDTLPSSALPFQTREEGLLPCVLTQTVQDQKEASAIRHNPGFVSQELNNLMGNKAPSNAGKNVAFSFPTLECRPDAGVPHREPAKSRIVSDKGNLDQLLAQQSIIQENLESTLEKDSDEEGMDAMFQAYRPFLRMTGAQPHPSPLVESDALRMVKPPKVKAKVRLPFQAVRDGKISDVQIESVALAVDSNSRQVPGTSIRRSFIMGQGTGFGKGTTLATMAMNYWLGGARKILWLSKSADLIADARRDWKWIGGDESVVFLLNQEKNSIIERTGIMFATYTTMGMEQKAVQGDKEDPTRAVMKGIDRLEQVLAWKPDLILGDESHCMANSLGESAAGMAVRSIKLMEGLPDTPVVLASATAATEVHNLAYATDRLGISGPQMSAFPSKHSFIAKIGSAGMLAMELVAKDMKTMGNYMSQNLSYNGTTFRMLEHALSPNQIEQYNTAAEAWRMVMGKMNEAIEMNNAAASPRTKALIGSQFYSAMQRFFNQLLTSMKTPSAIRDMEKALESGHACVIQLVNTNEAATSRAVAEASAEGLSLDEMDISPKDTLIGLIRNVFPVVLHQLGQTKEGKTVSIPVKDKDDKFVLNPEAVEMRDDLIRRVADLAIPEGALDMVINHFGYQNVAEISGRKERFVTKQGRNQGDLGVTKMRQSRGKSACNAEALDFNDGKRKILIFSGAGNTGRSMHADKRFKNQLRRMHYVLQPGWRADEALQGLGRTHRTNQSSAPEYVLLTTNLKGEKRFITSIARRIEQLGSLTKGNRKAASGGLFSGEDNLESEYATKATYLFFQALKAQAVPGLVLTTVVEQMGLQDMIDETGNILQKKVPKVTRFLNRILCLNTDVQDHVFDAWFGFILDLVEKAKEAGTFDKGVEKINAHKVTKVSETDVYTDPETGAVTRIVELQTLDRTRFVSLEQAETGKYVADNLGGFSQTWREEFYAFVKHTLKAGPHAGEVRVQAVHKGISFDGDGNVTHSFRKINPFAATKISELEYMAEKNVRIDRAEAEQLWTKSVAEAPEWESSEIYLLTGALLPIWDKIPSDKARIVAAETTSKERFLGRVIENDNLHALLNNLGALTEGEFYTPEQLIDFVMKKDAKLLLANKWRVQKRRTAGEDRLIVTNISNSEFSVLRDQGHVKYEWIGQNLYYIPLDDKVVEHFVAITKNRRVVQMDRGGVVTLILSEPRPAPEEKAVMVEEPEFYNIDHLIELYDMETGLIRPIADLRMKTPHQLPTGISPVFDLPVTSKLESGMEESVLGNSRLNPAPIEEVSLPSEKRIRGIENPVPPSRSANFTTPFTSLNKLHALLAKAEASTGKNSKARKVVEMEEAGQMSLF